MFGLRASALRTKERDIINAAAGPLSTPTPEVVVVAEPPKKKGVAAPSAAPVLSRIEELTEYARVASEIGLPVPALTVEEFASVLIRLNYPVYNLDAVAAYMDDKATREGTGWGWEWRALRDKDRMPTVQFGRAAQSGLYDRTPAHDYYAPTWSAFGGTNPMPLYSHVVPLHALNRIAAIEKEYKGPVHFLVTEYTAQPHLRPDPFLMAVIPNPHVGDGVGRFVIDFWDEPGFGITQMLK